MKALILTALGTISLAPAAQAQTIFLSCQLTSGPEHTPSDLYTRLPSSQDEFIEDLWEAGLPGLVTDPPTTWVVDLAEGTVKTPGEGPNFEITRVDDSQVEANFITESGNLRTWRLNRINGGLSITNILDLELQQDWQAEHGKMFPNLWTWEQQCHALDRPMM